MAEYTIPHSGYKVYKINGLTNKSQYRYKSSRHKVNNQKIYLQEHVSNSNPARLGHRPQLPRPILATIRKTWIYVMENLYFCITFNLVWINLCLINGCLIWNRKVILKTNIIWRFIEYYWRWERQGYGSRAGGGIRSLLHGGTVVEEKVR